MDFTGKFTGFVKMRVLQINPDKDWIEENLGEVLEEEPSYIYEEKGSRCATIDTYMETVTGEIFKHTIELKDEERTGKNSTYMYLNCLGEIQWCQNEDQIWESKKYFVEVLSWKKDGVVSKKYVQGAVPNEKEIIGNKQLKIALYGEDELLHLIKMIEQPNMYNIDTNLFLDTNKLFDGDFSTLQKMIRTTTDFHFTAFLYLNEKFEQKVWKEFLKVEFMREVMSGMKITYSRKTYNEWLKNLEYAVNGHYVLDKFQPFQEIHVMNQKEISQDGSDY